MTVRQLATKAEEQILERHGLNVATALVLCPSRDSAIPFYDTAADYVGTEVIILSESSSARHFVVHVHARDIATLPMYLWE